MTLHVRVFGSLILLLILISTVAARASDSLQQTAYSFAVEFWGEWSQNNETALPFIEGAVSNNIIFYGKAINLDKFMEIQTAFAERWPNRRYTVEPGTLIINCNDTSMTCVASGIVDWRDESPIRRVISTGSAKFKFDILFHQVGEDLQPKIVAETGAVLSRKLTVEVGDSQGSQISANQNVPVKPTVITPYQIASTQSSPSISPAYSSDNEEQKNSFASSVLGLIGGALLLWIFGGLVFYFAPWIVAISRGVSSSFAIFAVNLLFGWTFIGWIAAMIMALTAQTKLSVAIERETLRHLRRR